MVKISLKGTFWSLRGLDPLYQQQAVGRGSKAVIGRGVAERQRRLEVEELLLASWERWFGVLSSVGVEVKQTVPEESMFTVPSTTRMTSTQ